MEVINITIKIFELNKISLMQSVNSIFSMSKFFLRLYQILEHDYLLTSFYWYYIFRNITISKNKNDSSMLCRNSWNISDILGQYM